jgi:hypothetical protein
MADTFMNMILVSPTLNKQPNQIKLELIKGALFS